MVPACNFTKSNTPPWMFFTFLKLYRWYQIAQHILLTKISFCIFKILSKNYVLLYLWIFDYFLKNINLINLWTFRWDNYPCSLDDFWFLKFCKHLCNLYAIRNILKFPKRHNTLLVTSQYIFQPCLNNCPGMLPMMDTPKR